MTPFLAQWGPFLLSGLFFLTDIAVMACLLMTRPEPVWPGDKVVGSVTVVQIRRGETYALIVFPGKVSARRLRRWDYSDLPEQVILTSALTPWYPFSEYGAKQLVRAYTWKPEKQIFWLPAI